MGIINKEVYKVGIFSHQGNIIQVPLLNINLGVYDNANDLGRVEGLLLLHQIILIIPLKFETGLVAFTQRPLSRFNYIGSKLQSPLQKVVRSESEEVLLDRVLLAPSTLQIVGSRIFVVK